MRNEIQELPAPRARVLTYADFQQLAELPPAVAWFASIDNPHTRRAWQHDSRTTMHRARDHA
jgi:hypothetical protein